MTNMKISTGMWTRLYHVSITYNQERNQLLDIISPQDDDVMITLNVTKTTATYPFLGLATSFRAE